MVYCGQRMVVGDDRYEWTLAHQHEEGTSEPGAPRYRDCREVVLIAPAERLAPTLRIVFREGSGRVVSDGIYMHSGGVMQSREEGGGSLNLNEPGVVRALLDEALARGWDPGEREPLEIDGWAMFDAVYSRRTAQLEAREAARKTELARNPPPDPTSPNSLLNGEPAPADAQVAVEEHQRQHQQVRGRRGRRRGPGRRRRRQ
jgi:hypothetical protein